MVIKRTIFSVIMLPASKFMLESFMMLLVLLKESEWGKVFLAVAGEQVRKAVVN